MPPDPATSESRTGAGRSAPAGAGRFTFATWLFLRMLAVVHGIAFVSLWVQLEGLIGANGIMPAPRFFAVVHEQLGVSAYWRLPSLCWVFGADAFLPVLCAGGVVLSVLLFAGVAPPVCLALLWAAYLSLIAAGQEFFNFQWDSLLLETTLLAAWVAPWSWLPGWRAHEPSRIARWLIWWLLFRLMFLAGVVKLASGDTAWRDLSALSFHYETQPLPTPIAWWAHQAPLWWHRAECAGMFVLELVVPFLLFAPRALRHLAALLLAAFMGAVALTGNYTFFNLLAIALCLSCLDDAWWSRVLPARIRPAATPPPERRTPPGWLTLGCGIAVAGWTLALALAAFLPRTAVPAAFHAVAGALAPFRSMNNYGLFAVMTRPRPELIFEGSHDGREWRPYEFPHKPGDLARRPTWVAPHQPRLDWQLWFAALGPPAQNRWVLSVCEHLLRGTPAVLRLLGRNPFPERPPRFVRVVRYEYHFTDPETRRRTGQWWRRTPLDFYVGPASLKPP